MAFVLLVACDPVAERHHCRRWPGLGPVIPAGGKPVTVTEPVRRKRRPCLREPPPAARGPPERRRRFAGAGQLHRAGTRAGAEPSPTPRHIRPRAEPRPPPPRLPEARAGVAPSVRSRPRQSAPTISRPGREPAGLPAAIPARQWARRQPPTPITIGARGRRRRVACCCEFRFRRGDAARSTSSPAAKSVLDHGTRCRPGLGFARRPRRPAVSASAGSADRVPHG